MLSRNLQTQCLHIDAVYYLCLHPFMFSFIRPLTLGGERSSHIQFRIFYNIKHGCKNSFIQETFTYCVNTEESKMKTWFLSSVSCYLSPSQVVKRSKVSLLLFSFPRAVYFFHFPFSSRKSGPGFVVPLVLTGL